MSPGCYVLYYVLLNLRFMYPVRKGHIPNQERADINIFPGKSGLDIIIPISGNQ